MIAVLTVAGVLTLVAAALYLIYEGAALLEEAIAQHFGRRPYFITISEIVRGFEVKHRILFLSVCLLWVLFGIWFAIHIVFSCCP